MVSKKEHRVRESTFKSCSQRQWDGGLLRKIKELTYKSYSGYITGSATIEAVIIVPFILLCILFIIYIPLKLYEKTFFRAITDLTAQKGSSFWADINKDINTGRLESTENKERTSLYWRVIDVKKEDKKNKLIEWINCQLNTNVILNNGESLINITIKDYIVLKRLIVKVTYRNNSPIEKILYRFGIIQYNHKKEFIKVEALIFEPAEFIRSMDLIIEMGERFKAYCPDFEELIAGFVSSAKEGS